MSENKLQKLELNYNEVFTLQCILPSHIKTLKRDLLRNKQTKMDYNDEAALIEIATSEGLLEKVEKM